MQISHRRTKTASGGDNGGSLADALLALAILVLAFALALSPIAAAAESARNIADTFVETIRVRRLALETAERQ